MQLLWPFEPPSRRPCREASPSMSIRVASGPPRRASSGRTGGHLSYVAPSTCLRVPVVIPVRQCVRPSRPLAARTFARVRAVTREYAGAQRGSTRAQSCVHSGVRFRGVPRRPGSRVREAREYARSPAGTRERADTRGHPGVPGLRAGQPDAT